MNENDIPDITSFEQDTSTTLGEAVENFQNEIGDFPVSPFWKSTIIRVGVVIVACKIVNGAVRIIMHRNSIKNGL